MQTRFAETQASIEVEPLGPTTPRSSWSRSSAVTATRWVTRLRRVLLSSMTGYAPTEVPDRPASCTSTRRIDGVHEDVVDILLNLKGVVFKPAQP